MKPQRIQRKRGQGFPISHSKDVGRNSRWGNPFILPDNPTVDERDECVDRYERHLMAGTLPVWKPGHIITVDLVRKHLRGWNLACGCDVGDRCHGDVLLKIANTDKNRENQIENMRGKEVC